MGLRVATYALGWDPLDGFAMERFGLLTREQSEAVCEFLRFMAEETAGMADDVAARRALDKYWSQFCNPPA